MPENKVEYDEGTSGNVVMPGDVIELSKQSVGLKIVLGPGLRQDTDSIVYATKSGILKKRNGMIFYVDSYQKRYVPVRGDEIIGVVTQKAGDIFKVDIGASELASLSYLAFEGTSKKNRPDVLIGDLVYARLAVASKDMEPELVCVDSHGKKGKLGVLDYTGMVLTCSQSLVRKIRHPDCPFLEEYAKGQAFEIAIGMNGKIWIKCSSINATLTFANAILAVEFTRLSDMRALCNDIAQLALQTL